LAAIFVESYIRAVVGRLQDEQIRGTLTAGKLANLVVLSNDILTLLPTEILKTKVLLTVMGGKDTYRDTGF
jgi:predicted amidohydrolase YtcJ